MKKPLAILLVFFIVFAPVYSNAVLPALAASVASNGGRVLVANTIKKVAPQALANARKAAIGICKSNPRLCGGLGVGGVIGALAGDGWNIEITNTDVNNIDVDIYKLRDDEEDCGEVYICPSTIVDNTCTTTPAAYWSAKKPSFPPGDITEYQNKPPVYKGFTPPNYKDNAKKEYLKNGGTAPVSINFSYENRYQEGQWQTTNSFLSARAIYVPKTCPVNTKTYITNNELNQYITNNMTNNDIDIKDIYNFDFSQYNINIGGNTYNGTTINNDLSKSDPSEADKKVSPNLKKDIEDKKVNMDDVNDQNCTKNEVGEYDKCNGSEEPVDPEEPTDPEPEPPPIECDANGFYKKVCDWMDWTQKPHDKPDSGNVDIIDKSEGLNIDQNRIDFTNQCPAPTPINTSVGGFPVSTELNYQPLCDFFEMLNPFVIGMGGISSALIIAGGARRG